MTTARTYNCNLCRGRIAPTGEDDRMLATGYGVVFGGSHVPDQPLFKFDRVQDAENHICEPCVMSIVTLRTIRISEQGEK